MGEAAIAWRAAVRERDGSLAQAEHVGWREAHELRKRSRAAAERVGPLRERFAALAAPERARLEAELPEAKKVLADLEGQYYGSLHFQIKHPEALRRLHSLDDQIATVGYELDIQRQALDGIGAQPPQLHQQQRGIEREAPGLEREIEFRLGTLTAGQARRLGAPGDLHCGRVMPAGLKAKPSGRRLRRRP